MRKLWFILFVLITSLIIYSGCGGDQDADLGDDVNETESNIEEQEDEGEAEEVGLDDNRDLSGDFAPLIQFIEEETQGTTKVIYENNDAQVHEMEGVKVSLDAYTLIELNDFHTDYSIPFNDMTDGGVLIASYSVTNELDEDIYYMPDFYLSFTGADKHYNNYRNLLPLEEQLPGKLTPDTDYLVEAGQTVSGYYTYPFGEDVLATVLDLGTVSIDVPAPFAKADDFGSEFGSKGNFALSLSAAGAERVEANQAFYNDKVTADNMGNKEMIKEQTEIGESEQLGDVTVTFEGYQFTEFTPTEVEAPRFENFTNGIVLLTAKFELDNQSSDAIRLTSMSSKLTVNDGTQYILSENMLLNYSYSELISAGNSGELLQIFVLDQEQYEKIWKDKAFEIEVGPIINEDAEDISKGHKALFEL